MANYLNEEQILTLRNLANRWMMLARDYDRDSKNAKITPERVEYLRGLSEAFRKSSLDLANMLRSAGATVTGEASTAAVEEDETKLSISASPEAAKIRFMEIDQTEAIRFLSFVGATPRDVIVRRDNTILAVFSKMQPIAENDRLNLIRNADKRVVILSTGKTRDARDPFVEFGFRLTS